LETPSGENLSINTLKSFLLMVKDCEI